MPFNAKVIAEIIGTYSKTKGQGTATFDLGYRAPAALLTTGTGPNQCDLAYRGLGRSIVGAVNDDIDLTGATLDALGDPLPMAKVRGVLIYAYDANPAALRVGAGTNGALLWFTTLAHTEDVPSGGTLLHTNPLGTQPWTVTAGTVDILRVANPTAVTTFYDILIWGSSV